MLLDDLLSMVYEYLEHAISLEELEDWVIYHLPLLFQIPDSPVARLAAAIELGLAEIGDGVVDEEEFRNVLEAAVRKEVTLSFFYPADMPISESTSSNEVQHHSVSIGSPEPIRAAAWGQT